MLYWDPAMLPGPRCYVRKDVGNHYEQLLRHHFTVLQQRSLYHIPALKCAIPVVNIFHNLLALATDSGLLSNALKYFLRPWKLKC